MWTSARCAPLTSSARLLAHRVDAVQRARAVDTSRRCFCFVDEHYVSSRGAFPTHHFTSCFAAGGRLGRRSGHLIGNGANANDDDDERSRRARTRPASRRRLCVMSSSREERGGGGATGGDHPSTWTGGSEASLEAWLRDWGVDPSAFGVGGAKALSDLTLEVENGEATLEVVAGAPMRSVRVLQLLIRDDRGRVLIEARQEWEGKSPRERGTPLSEKLLGGENWAEAAPRAVAEELGSALEPGYELVVDESSLAVREVERDSLSYPGLRSRYAMHSVEARILNGFPGGTSEEGFTSVEDTPRGRLTATWVWRDAWVPPDSVEV